MRKMYLPIVDVPGTDTIRALSACNTPDEAAAMASDAGLMLAEIETVYMPDNYGYVHLCYHLIGRALQADVLSPEDGSILAHKNTILTAFLVDALSLDCGIDEVLV